MHVGNSREPPVKILHSFQQLIIAFTLKGRLDKRREAYNNEWSR